MILLLQLITDLTNKAQRKDSAKSFTTVNKPLGDLYEQSSQGRGNGYNQGNSHSRSRGTSRSNNHSTLLGN